MWAYAQRDGRPGNIGGTPVENDEEQKFHALYHATKFGSRQLFECRAM